MIYVALLRGINVGGNTLIKMSDLKDCFTKLGFSDVTTYINSGNVIFKAAGASNRLLETKIEKALVDTFSYPIKAIVHNLPEIKSIIKKIPVSWHKNVDQKCNVIFLRHTIDSPDITRGLNPKPGIEELAYVPGVLFWSAKTSNLTKSSMIKLSREGIYQEMTVRNLNTARKILGIMSALKN